MDKALEPTMNKVMRAYKLSVETLALLHLVADQNDSMYYDRPHTWLIEQAIHDKYKSMVSEDDVLKFVEGWRLTTEGEDKPK